MTYLALDLSKRRTGYAAWGPAFNRPLLGNFQLGSEYTGNGQTYVKLLSELGAMHRLHGFEAIFYEEPINPGQLSGHTTIDTIRVLCGIAEHVESFAYAKGIKARAVNVERWRKDFVGDMVVREVKAGVRRKRKAGDLKASARDHLKSLTVERCRQLGMEPSCNDEADAAGILTYSLLLAGITPPWIEAETLRPMLGAA